jgi:hypothetical protein
MKAKSLTYNIEREQFFKMVDNDDFIAFLETGRMLNAVGIAAEACREVYERQDHGYRSREAASFLNRLNTQMLKLVEGLADRYLNEPFFEHFKEMFSGAIRDFPGLTVNRMRPAEFRLISRDETITKAIRQLDVYGIDVLFPSDPAAQMEAFHHEGVSQFEFGRYSAIRPNDRLELQHLVRSFTVIHDFAIGAEIVLKALAKKLGFKTARVNDDSEPTNIKANMPKWYEKN